MKFFDYDNSIVFKSFNDVYHDSIALAGKLQKYNYKYVIGVAKSGIYPAYLIAKYLGLILYIADTDNPSAILPKVGEDAIIIDDSIYTGHRYEILQAHYGPNFNFACLYVRSDNKHIPLEYVEIIDKRRIFFYNLFKHKVLKHTYMDLDGLICADPAHKDDTVDYVNSLSKLKLKHKPQLKIKAILTNRLEEHRAATAQWLAKHNILYDILYMAPNRASRVNNNFKRDILNRDKPLLYVDSHVSHAKTLSIYTNTIGLIED